MRDEKKIGMFGGKFLPMHKGHELVVKKAFSECDVVYLCLFVNSPEEKAVAKAWYTDKDFRYYQLKKAAEKARTEILSCYGRSVDYTILVIDCDKYQKNGMEDWYAEAEYIKRRAKRIDMVFSSERGYDYFFNKAYPGAEHIIVDPKRTVFSISATDIRNMDDVDEQIWWMV